MNVQPGSSLYSNTPANVNSQFYRSAAAAAVPASRYISDDDLRQAARQTDAILMQTMSAGGEEVAAVPAANQSYYSNLIQAARQAEMIQLNAMSALREGFAAAAAAPVSNRIYPNFLHQPAGQADIFRMTDSTHGQDAAAAFMSDQIYRIDQHQANRQAEIIRMNAMSARGQGVAAAAAISSQSHLSNLSLEDRRAEISRLIDMSSCGQYVNALDPAADSSWAAVFAAVVYRRADVLGKLFESDPNPSAAPSGAMVTTSRAAARANAVTRDGLTALMLAAKSGASDIVEILLRAGAKVDALDATGTNALMLAVSTENSGAVSALLKAHPTLNHVNNEGVTALMVAAGNGNLAMVKLLASAGEDIHANLFRTIQGGKYSLEAVNTLLRAGADPNTTVDGCTVLTAAAQRGNTLLMGALLTAGAQFAPAVMTHISGPSAAAGNACALAGSNALMHLAQHSQVDMPNALPQAQTHAYAAAAHGNGVESAVPSTVPGNDQKTSNDFVNGFLI